MFFQKLVAFLAGGLMFGYLSADEEGGCGGAESIVPMDADPDITYIDADGEKYVWLGDPEDAPDSIEI